MISKIQRQHSSETKPTEYVCCMDVMELLKFALEQRGILKVIYTACETN